MSTVLYKHASVYLALVDSSFLEASILAYRDPCAWGRVHIGPGRPLEQRHLVLSTAGVVIREEAGDRLKLLVVYRVIHLNRTVEA